MTRFAVSFDSIWFYHLRLCWHWDHHQLQNLRQESGIGQNGRWDFERAKAQRRAERDSSRWKRWKGGMDIMDRMVFWMWMMQSLKQPWFLRDFPQHPVPWVGTASFVALDEGGTVGRRKGSGRKRGACERRGLRAQGVPIGLESMGLNQWLCTQNSYCGICTHCISVFGVIWLYMYSAIYSALYVYIFINHEDFLRKCAGSTFMCSYHVKCPWRFLHHQPSGDEPRDMEVDWGQVVKKDNAMRSAWEDA